MRRRRPFWSAVLLLAALMSVPAGGPGTPPQAAAQDGAGAAPAPGQAASQVPPMKLRVFTIRYKDVDDIYMLISPVLGPRGSIQSQPRQKTLAVIDEPDTLLRVAEIVAAHDLPPRNVEVSVQLILATAAAPGAEPPPPPIRGVIDRLSALNTRWNDYRMVGDARILGTEGERSSLRVGDDYRLDFRIEQVADESRIIRFKPFELQRRELTVEGNERYSPILTTVLNLRDAQQFIVGASRVERGNRALFMTITASLQRD